MTLARASSSWAPLGHKAFRALWIAMLVSNIGTWFQNVTAGWVMVSLSSSAFMVAAVQAATNLPLVLLGLPSGALADIVDRRGLVLAMTVWMTLVASGLAVVSLAGELTPLILVLFVFALATGSALMSPAFQALVPELVPRRELGAAIALNGANFNVARAIGPALAGLVLARTSPAVAFAANAASFIGVILVMRAYRPKRSERSVPPESFLGALSVGIRFVRHSPDFQAVLFRSGAFVFFAAVLWALLPLTSRSLVRTTATGYGLLLGALGVGAVMGGLLLLSLRRRFGPERPTLVATLAYAGAIAGLSQAPPLGVAVVLMLLCGAAWSIVLSTMSVSAQILLPSWVRARGLAASMSMIFGSMGVGSLVWGVLCTRVGLPATLEVAAFGLVLAHGTSFFFRLPRGEGPNLEPAKIRPLPSYSTEIAGDEGPVLILVEYDVASEDELAFGEAAANLRAVRMRSGALSWNLYRDPDRPGYYVEAFLDRSWHDHLRLHHRATMADRAVEDEVLSFHRGQMPPVTHHLVAAMKLPTTRLGNA